MSQRSSTGTTQRTEVAVSSLECKPLDDIDGRFRSRAGEDRQ